MRRTLGISFACLSVLCSAVPASAAVDRRGVDPSSPNPLVGERWYADPKEPAYQSYVEYASASRNREAALMSRIAFTPRFRWFGRFTSPPSRRVSAFIERAQAAGAVPLVATLRHQGKECHAGYTAGGVAEDEATKAWFRDFAAGIGNRRIVIAYEPDSVGTIECLARSRRQARLDVLRYGIDVLSQLPNATIYIEATASDWKSPSLVARRLRYIGIHKVRGFMVNVTHYDWTASNVRYGLRISARVGGKPFIVSTAMNGRGPVHYKRREGRRTRRINVFCHPLYRGAGPYPTTNTMHPKVDAYMWVNRAGYSGGSCNGGPLPVGTWWPKRALMFARYQSNRVRPARGTRYGFRKGKLSLRRVAGDQYRR